MASTTKRWSVILLSLGATLAAVAKVSGEDPTVAEIRPVMRAVAPIAAGLAMPAAATALPDELRVAVLSQRAMDGDIDGVFTVPPKPPAPEKQKAAPPEPPQAPPLPLRLLGRMTEKGVQVLFLSWNDQNLVARVGDVIEETYRLESIAGGQAEFVYLPLKTRQSLSLGEDS